MANPQSAYLDRVRAHLATAPASEQVPFLTRQIERWTSLYAAFSRLVDGSEDYEGSATAFDYLETIASLDMMKKEREHVA